MVPLALTILICGRETGKEQNIKNGTNPITKLFMSDTTNNLSNPCMHADIRFWIKMPTAKHFVNDKVVFQAASKGKQQSSS